MLDVHEPIMKMGGEARGPTIEYKEYKSRKPSSDKYIPKLNEPSVICTLQHTLGLCKFQPLCFESMEDEVRCDLLATNGYNGQNNMEI